MNTARYLIASINRFEVGRLQEVSGVWRFQYSPEWLENPQGFALSPHLPLASETILDGASLRPVQWYFDNLLPEEGQRVLLAKDAKLDSADAFGLLSWYGAESAGSLALLLPEAPIQSGEELRPLTDEALDKRIQQLPKAPLTQAAIKRMSLAGAQHKLAVVLKEGELFEPAGFTPSTHILKPDHPDEDYAHSVINEWFVMKLAKRMGLDVPEVHRRYVPSPVYLIDRFDRFFLQSQGWQRQHVIDACQLLGLDKSFKYTQGSVERLGEIAAACRSPAVARTSLFRWLVFNVLVGNSDAHLKNLSFTISHEGIQLAPFYDLLSVAVYDTPAFEKQNWPKQTELAWPILGVNRFADMNRQLLIEAGLKLKISKSTSLRLIDSLCQQIATEASMLYTEIQNDNNALMQIRPELSARLAGESRCLGTILYAVIKDMVQKMKS